MKHFNDFIRAFAYCRTMWIALSVFYGLRFISAIGSGEFGLAWVCLFLVAINICGLLIAISYWRKR